MTNEQFDALVDLMKTLAYRAAGAAIHQPRAGNEDVDIEFARSICVEEEPAYDDTDEFAQASLGDMANR